MLASSVSLVNSRKTFDTGRLAGHTPPGLITRFPGPLWGQKMRLPGLVDVHVHLREPGGTHKEDFDSGTCAALAGGFTTVLAMPNTRPAVTDGLSLQLALDAAAPKVRCDFAHFAGATPHNSREVAAIAPRVAGLKLYLNHTFGELKLGDITQWMEHFEQWPHHLPMAFHAEGQTLATVILLGQMFERPVHLCHVATREEILLITRAKEKGWPVTCEVAPHHLLLSTDDIPTLGRGRSHVCPHLASPLDVATLWEHLDSIDCFATDHAPHTLPEKDSDKPPPGFPGLETALPLLLTAIHDGKLTEAELIDRLYHRPRQIFNLPEQVNTWVEVDENERWTVPHQMPWSRSGWTPFAGREVFGRVERVVLRGRLAFEGGRILAVPGSGLDLRAASEVQP